MNPMLSWTAPVEGSRILIVDDVEDNRIFLHRQLTRAGFKTSMAASGIEALAGISADPPDLVLLDWMMPNLSGLDTLRAMREHYDLNQLPIIMCTARDEESSIVDAIESGANDYIQKPIKMPVLIARMSAQLMRRAAMAALDAANLDLEKTLAERTRALLETRFKGEKE
ncbi:response regulator [Allosphingosinicella sp.]|uniref:response regulator n=1 Tax=Allosphingosinicella sp. TaxID=2823234 RepID=UPI002FC0E100